MDEISLSLKDKQEVYNCYLDQFHDLADAALARGDVAPGDPMINKIILTKLGALLLVGNWSSKLNPELPTKVV